MRYVGNSLWNSKPIPLEVHHIDGNKTNNTLENLMIVCPNCHKMSFDKYNNVKERNMKPLNSLILIKYEEPTEKKTDSGLYVPQAVETVTAQNFLKEGTVVAVNEEEKTIKVGDIVYFNIRAKAVVPEQPNMFFVRKEDLYGIK